MDSVWEMDLIATFASRGWAIFPINIPVIDPSNHTAEMFNIHFSLVDFLLLVLHCLWLSLGGNVHVQPVAEPDVA